MSSEFTLGMMYLLAYFSIAIEKEGGDKEGEQGLNMITEPIEYIEYLLESKKITYQDIGSEIHCNWCNNN